MNVIDLILGMELRLALALPGTGIEKFFATCLVI